MRSDIFDRDYDLTPVIIKPLYFGLMTNILLPTGLLFICYLFEQGGGRSPLLAGGRGLFVLFAVLGVAMGVYAVWWRRRMVSQPMVRSLETFEEDFTAALLAVSRPVFILIAGIAGLGIVYYFVAAGFREAVFFVVLSFIVFQFVRPRPGSIHRLILKQRDMLRSGGNRPVG